MIDFNQPKQYVLVWPGRKPKRISYGGLEVQVPSRDRVAVPGKASPYRYGSAQHGGSPIPGTVVVVDEFRPGPDGETVLSGIGAEAWTKGILRTQKLVLEMGLRVVASAAEAAAAMAEGLQVYREHELTLATQIIRKEDHRLAAYEQANGGQPAMPLRGAAAVELEEAMQIVREAAQDVQAQAPQFSRAELMRAMGQVAPDPTAVPVPRVTPAAPIPTPQVEAVETVQGRSVADAIIAAAESPSAPPLRKDEWRALATHDEVGMLAIVERLQEAGVEVAGFPMPEFAAVAQAPPDMRG